MGCSQSNQKVAPVTTSHSVTIERQTGSYGNHKSHNNLDDKQKRSHRNADEKVQSIHDNLDDKHKNSNCVVSDKDNNTHRNLDDKHKISDCFLSDIENFHCNLDDKHKNSDEVLSDKDNNTHRNLDDKHKSSDGILSDKENNIHCNLDDKQKSSHGSLDVQPKIKKAARKYDYKKIDQHARKAPGRMKNSAADLVNYMSTVSKDPRTLVRGFFVWISKNIAYDVDGFFGRTSCAPCDAESVMKGGRSVCEGYANVMELLCRQAGVPVKKISGYAKGYGTSAANPFTSDMGMDHAWNAVQLEGKWYLIDSTWGAGHIDVTNSFMKKFEDFYFLTDPAQFISAHFPYMNKNMEESMKWQLLSKPMSLDQFNKNVKYEPEAFKLGAKAVSHQHGYIEMKNELEMTFKSIKEEPVFCARLMLKEGNWLREQPNATFGYPENGLYKLLIRPPKPGSYRVTVFGKTVSDKSLEGIPELLEYSINCNEVEEKGFEYPMSYDAAGTEKSILHEPLRGNLPGNTEIKFQVSAPYLQNVMVGSTFLEKSGTTFSGNITTCEPGYQIPMYGTRGDKYSSMQGLYAFKTV